MNMVLASSATLLGVALLYSGWRRWLTPSSLTNLGGWLLIGLSAMLWSIAAGWEYGALYSITALPLVAWLFVAHRASIRPELGEDPKPQRLRVASWRAVAKHTGLILLTLPAAVLTSALLALWATSLMPWSEVNRLATLTLLMPTLWGLLMFWVCADPKRYRPAAAILLAGIGAAAAVQLG